MRRVLAGVVLGLLLCSSVAAAETTIVFKVKYQEDVWLDVYDRLVKNFQAKHPGIAVDVQPWGPGSINDQLVVQLAGGVAPDAAWFEDEFLPGAAKAGMLEDITTMAANSTILNRQHFLPTTFESVEWNGRLWGVPPVGSSVALYYNMDLFSSHGLAFPAGAAWTTQDMVNAAKRLTRDTDGDNAVDQYGYGMRVIGWPNFMYMQPWLWRYGGSILTSDRTASNLLHPGSIAGLEAYQSFITEHQAATPSEAVTQSAWKAGKLGFFADGAWNIPPYRELPFQWDVSVHPSGPAGSIERLSWDTVVIPRGTKHLKEAYLWLEYLMSEEAQNIMAENGKWIPARRVPAQTTWIRRMGIPPKNIMAFIEATANGRLSEITPYYAEINNMLNNIFNPVFRGTKAVRTACEEATQRLAAILSQG